MRNRSAHTRDMGSPGWPVWAQVALGLAVALLLWKKPSSGATEVLLWGATLYGLWHWRSNLPFWRNPAGIAFGGLALFTLIMLPFSQFPELSARDLTKISGIIGALWAIPAIFNTEHRVIAALLFSALALTLVFAADIIRLAWVLQGTLLTQARFHQPFALNHPNVASLMAGACVLSWMFAAWRWRAQKVRLMGCLALSALCLFYLFLLASRGPQLAFALTLTALVFILPGWRAKTLFALAMLLLGLLAAGSLQHINPRFMEKDSMRNFSQRDVVWKHALKLADEKPVLGHGYGKKVFEKVYYSSQPPTSDFHYPHTHEYWLMVFFESGLLGVGFYAAAWALLALRLARRIFAVHTLAGRALPALLGLILLMIHLYALGDYPDNIALTAMNWLIPLSLVVTTLPHENQRTHHNL